MVGGRLRRCDSSAGFGAFTQAKLAQLGRPLAFFNLERFFSQNKGSLSSCFFGHLGRVHLVNVLPETILEQNLIGCWFFNNQ